MVRGIGFLLEVAVIALVIAVLGNVVLPAVAGLFGLSGSPPSERATLGLAPPLRQVPAAAARVVFLAGPGSEVSTSGCL